MSDTEKFDWLESKLVQLTIQINTYHLAYYDDNGKAHYVEEANIRDCVEKAMKENE